jgi:hypothetical protein
VKQTTRLYLEQRARRKHNAAVARQETEFLPKNVEQAEKDVRLLVLEILSPLLNVLSLLAEIQLKAEMTSTFHLFAMTDNTSQQLTLPYVNKGEHI